MVGVAPVCVLRTAPRDLIVPGLLAELCQSADAFDHGKVERVYSDAEVIVSVNCHRCDAEGSCLTCQIWHSIQSRAAPQRCRGRLSPLHVRAEDLRACITFALSSNGRLAKAQSAELMASIVAERLIARLERDGFVIMRRPRGLVPRRGETSLAKAPRKRLARRRPESHFWISQGFRPRSFQERSAPALARKPRSV